MNDIFLCFWFCVGILSRNVSLCKSPHTIFVNLIGPQCWTTQKPKRTSATETPYVTMIQMVFALLRFGMVRYRFRHLFFKHTGSICVHNSRKYCAFDTCTTTRFTDVENCHFVSNFLNTYKHVFLQIQTLIQFLLWITHDWSHDLNLSCIPYFCNSHMVLYWNGLYHTRWVHASWQRTLQYYVQPTYRQLGQTWAFSEINSLGPCRIKSGTKAYESQHR